jgi:hypothetical protein
LIDDTSKKSLRRRYESRLDALQRSAKKAKSGVAGNPGSRNSLGGREDRESWSS